MPAAYKTIDEYLAGVDAPNRAALQALREVIREAAPEAVETIAWQMPAFRQGVLLLGFAAWARHCALYPMSVRVVDDLREELAEFDCSAGTIRFTPDKPLPAELVRTIVRARMAENAARKAKPRAPRAPRA